MLNSSLMEVKSLVFYFLWLFCELFCEQGISNVYFMFVFADASMYAHYLFNAFDTTNNGTIKFKVI